jgi:catechol 2,3-dioxygenase-like lactoylglutathione lyase family enzyme
VYWNAIITIRRFANRSSFSKSLNVQHLSVLDLLDPGEIINVLDPARATAFYRDTLGLPLLFTAGNLSFFDCGGVRLILTRAEKSEFDPSVLFAVPDIVSAHREMLSRGARFEDQPHLIAKLPTHDLWMTFFRDSEENLLALMCEMPQAG